MKLLHYTYRKLSAFFLLMMVLWGALFYYTVIDEVEDETDDTLQNYAHILIKHVLEDASLLQTKGDLMSFYEFRPITEEEGRSYRERFYNATTYIEIEDEYEPVRVFRTAYRMTDGRYYELTVMLSTLEYDDMMEAIFFYLALLFVAFLILTTLGIRTVLKGVYHPLNRLMEWLHAVKPDQKMEPLDNPTAIREFRELTTALVDLTNRSYKAYEEQKQFIENASHELQTPLAIARTKIELLAETATDEQQLKELDAVYNTLGRAVRLNKSLLLLSRIDNGQFADKEDVDAVALIDSILPDLEDIYEHKQIQVSRRLDAGPLVFHGNRALLHILISNLLKNALQHNRVGGVLQIETDASTLTISNNGEQALDATKLFSRFYHEVKGKEDSNGLGLAIARSIAQASSLRLSYRWEDAMHCFSLVKESK